MLSPYEQELATAKENTLGQFCLIQHFFALVLFSFCLLILEAVLPLAIGYILLC